MFGNFDEEARKVISSAKKEMSNLKHPYVGSEHLLLGILKSNNDVSSRLKEYGLTYNKFRKELINIVGIGKTSSTCFLYTPLLKRVIEGAITDSKERDEDVSINQLFSSLLEEGEGVAIRIMLGMNIDLEELYNEFAEKIIHHSKKGLLVDELGIDLNKKAKELDPVIGRDKEVKRVIEILNRRNKNNPILIGEAGVGKTAIVEALASKISTSNVPFSLQNKRIISLDMATIVAGTKYRGEFEDRVRKIIKELEDNDDIILFIDEIHTLVGAGGAEGAIDASNIFKPALARGKIKVIGSTTISEYKKYIENDKALARRFQNVYIEVPNKEMVHKILVGLKHTYEKYHNVVINDSILDLIVELSDKYIHDRNQPDKAIDILDEVCAYTSLKENKNIKKYYKLKNELNCIKKDKERCMKKKRFKEAIKYKEEEKKIVSKINDLELIINKRKKKEVSKADVGYILNIKTKIPIYELLNDNYSMIKEIENKISNKIIGQDNAIKEVMKIIKRIKLGYKDDRCYALLFCGPSGVGKTYLAKLFGDIIGNTIKLDMSDYMDVSSISKIVGSSPGYIGYEDSNILDDIKNKPYSVLILDEIEKANPAILNLFLQILDDSKIKNSKGEYIYFNNTIIVMTSNVGYETGNIGFSNKAISKLNDVFSIPFINRIDNIIDFNYLDENNIKEIINSKIVELKNKYKDKNIDIKIDDEIVDSIIKDSNYKVFGARKIDKIIKDKIEDYIIDNLINNNKNVEIKKLNLASI